VLKQLLMNRYWQLKGLWPVTPRKMLLNAIRFILFRLFIYSQPIPDGNGFIQSDGACTYFLTLKTFLVSSLPGNRATSRAKPLAAILPPKSAAPLKQSYGPCVVMQIGPFRAQLSAAPLKLGLMNKPGL
jgi:hypothetical protein